MQNAIRVVNPGEFDPAKHYYPRVPNAQLHPTVRGFLHLGNDRIARRYSHLHPEAEPTAVHELLARTPERFLWGGADLFHVADDHGVRRSVVLETNSCPSGQKSMPLLEDRDDLGGYRVLLERSFLPALRSRRRLPAGPLAVLSDKNEMETMGYARALADLTGEPVLWVPFDEESTEARTRWVDGVLEVLHDGEWRSIRAAFRYVTQRPWSRIPATSRTFIYNPVVVCLAGGRNKMLAAKAYDLFNGAREPSGLRLRVPETIWDVALEEIPMWVERMGGVAIVKNPYSNAGQGVWPVTSPHELERLMAMEHHYDQFIVQGLIGNRSWTSRTRAGRLYHLGTIPDRAGRIFVADLRVMVAAGPEGFFPVALYARRAPAPLTDTLTGGEDSWAMLGTNLSRKTDAGWTTEPDRLLLADRRDFNQLGLGTDDLVEAYVQACMAVTAIDEMAQRLLNAKGRFRRRLFRTLVPDDALQREVM